MASTFKKSKGNAGLEGVQFQLDLLTVFSLNALRNLTDWKISSENEQAGKYDDLVLELPDKNVFLQAKHKQTKKIAREQLFSTNSKNADFSLPKYFLSYLEIKSEVKKTTVMVCTNTDINRKGLEGILNAHHVASDSLLHYDGTTCPYFTFNENVLPDLRESAESYLEKNLQSKGVDKVLITDENMRNFLRNFQFFYNYPSGEELHQVIEGLLKRLGDLWSRTTYHEVYRKVEEWFKQPKGEYLTASRANAMLCEIRSERYCNSLKNYNVSFESNHFDLSNSNRIVQVKTDGRYLLQTLRIFQALHGDKAKQLYLNPDDAVEMQRLMVEAFGHSRYVFLIMVWSASGDDGVKSSMSSKLKEILEKNRYKKVVLLTEDDVDVAQLIGLEDISNVSESVTFRDFSKNYREWLLKNKNIVFQGERVSLEELLEMQAPEDYTLHAEMLEALVRGGEIKVGERVLNLDEDVAQLYVYRTFEKDTSGEGNTNSVISEENLFEVTEKIILISDCPGMGKTTTLTKLAVHVKQENSRMWVIKMNLIDYTRILKDSLGKGKKTVTVEELMNSQETTKIRNRFEEFTFHANRKIVLLLDGVDEIAPNYTSLILDLLRQCQEATNIAKVFATTRPHMTRKLRAVLQDVEFFKMLPFTGDHQIEFLINYWTHNLQLEDVNETRKCKLYAVILINKMSSWTDLYSDEVSLSAIPLQTRMIADIFQERSQSRDWESCEEFLKGIAQKPKLPEKFDIAKLYDMFIDKKRDIFMDKGNPSGNTAADQALINQFEECLVHHRSLALKAILTEDECNLFSNYCEDDCGLVLKIGIAQRSEDNLYFIHRTFAEYFVAASILQELQLNSSLEFQQFLIDKVLIDYEFIVIRNFLDNCLQNVVDFISSNVFSKYQSHTCDISFYLVLKLVDEGHLAILRLILKSIQFRIIRGKVIGIKDRQTNPGKWTMNTLNYLQIITREAGVNIQDLAGSTLLHRAADSRRLKMVKFLIGHGADVNIGDIEDNTPLLVAAKTDDLSVVKCLVKQGANVNHRNCDNITSLHFAARGGRVKIVKYLVECGANANNRSDDGCTALHMAASKGKLNVVEYLVEECGVGVNDISRGGRTALHLAAAKSKLNVVAYLLEHGANINDSSCDGLKALHWAVDGGSLDVVKHIMERGANVNDRCADGRTAFHMVGGQMLDIMKYLVECGANVNGKSNSGRTALHGAALRGQLDAVRFIRENGGNVNDRNNEGWSALHCAAMNGRLETIKYIVECGGNVNDMSNNGCTALHWAFNRAGLDAIKYIVARGSDINARDGDDRTALHWAAKRSELGIVKYLVECGSNVNGRDGDGRTALHWAAKRGELGVVKYLVEECGADIFDRSRDGSTALHLATRRGRLHAIKYIVRLGADVNDADDVGYTALHWAIEGGRLDVIKYIVERGANINHRYGNGLTALHCAAWGGKLDVIKYIVECGTDVTDRDHCDRTALHWVAKMGDLDAIKYVLECGANINDRDISGRTALHWAVEGGGLDNIKYFVECGASVNDRDCDGRTALHWAAEGGKLNVIGYLIECGARVNDRSNNGRTALHWAVKRCEVMAFEYLVKCGANVNERDSNGRTAAQLAREMDLEYADDFEALSEGVDNVDNDRC